MNKTDLEKKITQKNFSMFFKASSFVLCLFLVLLISTLSTNRSVFNVERNDTEQYFKQYNCEYEGGIECYKLASEDIAIIFNSIVDLFSSISSIFLIDIEYSFKIFIFIVAISVLLSLYFFNFKFIKNFYLLFPFYFLDPRLWELTTNTLKQGVCFVFILMGFYYINKQKIIKHIFIKFLAIFSHVSGFVIFFLYTKKINFLWLVICVLVVLILNEIDFINILSKYLGYGKLSFYVNNSNENDSSLWSSFSLLYLLIFIISIPIYISTKYDDMPFTMSFNIIFFCMLMGLLTSNIGIGYRFFFYLSPFIILLLDRVLDWIGIRFGFVIKISIFLLFFLLYVLRFYNNSGMILNHLS